MHKSALSILLASCVLLLASATARAEMLGDGWQFRRPLNFKQINSDAPGDNLAWVEFFSNGQHKPDGADLRITTPDRQLVPHKIMQVSADNDLIRVAFVTRGDGPYYAWWGNPNAAMPEKEAVISRGILMDVYKFPGGGVDHKDHLNKVLARLKSPLASDFINELFIGHNPLSEDASALTRYTGMFKVDKPMTANFAFTVNDTGWLSIDGKIIAEEYRKGMRGEVRDPKKNDLTAGWHKIEVVHLNQGGGNTGIAVVWKRPVDKNYEPMRGVIFAQAALASFGPLEKPGVPYVADFDITPAGEAFSPPDVYLPRYTFDAVYPVTFKPTAFTWDFGDGQTTTGALRKVNHYFLLPGTYSVKLKLEQAGNSFETTRRISVRSRMYELFPRPPEDKTATTAAVLKEYNLAKLSGEQALRGMLFFKREGINESWVTWGRAWAARPDAPADRLLFDEIFELSRLLQLRKEYKESAEVYKLAAAKPVSMESRLNLLRYYVMTQCDYLDDAAGALQELQGWDKKIDEANRRQVHILQTSLLYAAVARGDEKRAKAALAEAGNRKNLPYNEQQIHQGVMARNIENYIRTKEHDTALKLIDQWETEYPDSIWDGFTRTLRVKLYAAEGKPLIAARIAVQHARANPSGFYAAELLYRAAQFYKNANEETQSKAALDLLKSKYPESPYASGTVKAED